MPELFMPAASSPSSEKAYVATRLSGRLGKSAVSVRGRASASEPAGRRIDSRLHADAARDRSPVRARSLCDRREIVWSAARKIPRWRLRLPGGAGRRMADAIQSRLPLHPRINGRRFKVLLQRAKAMTRASRRCPDRCACSGTWQSYRYFEEAAETIRAEMRLWSEPVGANRIWLDRIRQSNSVCLHVRRGDYLMPDPSGIANRLCPISYYYRAVQFIRERLGNPQIYVFSDDWLWCREHLAIEGAVLVDANGPEAVVDELRLMAACRHHIIANSSLSWWAAWLPNHPEQVVIAPQPWVGLPAVAGPTA